MQARIVMDKSVKMRFYLKEKFAAGTTVFLQDSEHHHLTHVLRKKEGEEVELVNGEGGKALARIEKMEKTKTSLRILEVVQAQPRSHFVYAGIPLMRPSKLEWVIEKGTELGADAFFLYAADRSTQNSLSEHQIERFWGITISALKQSKRLYLPSLEILPDLSSLLEKEALIFFGDFRESAQIFDPKMEESTMFITGPESGFSIGELKLLDGKGVGVRINPNVLRAETASIAGLSLVCVHKKEPTCSP